MNLVSLWLIFDNESINQKMSSIIEEYNYDIFISYRQKDNKGDRWVSEFVEALKTELESTFKEDISIYFDINPHDGLLETHDVDDSLKEKLKCLIFIPIISRTYCDPKSFAWEHELKAFIEQAEKDQFGLKVKLANGNVASRVLPVRIHDLDPDDIRLCESVTGGKIRSIDFIYSSAGVNRPLRAGEDHPHDNLSKTYYRDQINKVANAIRETLISIEKQDSNEPQAPSEGNKKVPVPPAKPGSIVFVASLILIAILALGYLLVSKLQVKSRSEEKSIAVLPFINDSQDEENTYFINGVMEEVLINLQKIKDLRVISRNSVEQFRGPEKPSTPVIARRLGVKYIVEGSGQKYGNNLRLRIQLIEADNDRHLWAESYEHEIKDVKDIFSIQSSIARSIAEELKAIMTPEELELIRKVPTQNITAYDLYQRGREEYSKYLSDNNNKEALEKAEEYYHKALDIDPEFASAYAGLARIYWNKYFWNEYFSENFMDSVLVLADNALSYDDKTVDGYFLKGLYYFYKGDREKALEAYDKAIKISPNSWEVYREKSRLFYNDLPVPWLENLHKAASLNRGEELPDLLRGIAGVYNWAGFGDLARNCITEAYELDGDSISYFLALAGLENQGGNYNEGIKYYEKVNSIDSISGFYDRFLGVTYGRTGQYSKSLWYFRKYLKQLEKSGQLSLNDTHRIGYAFWQNGYKKEADYYFDKQMEYCNNLIKSERPYARNHYTYYDRAGVYAFRGDKERAYEDLKIFSQRESFGVWIIALIKIDPLFDSIREDPEFKQLISDMEAKHQAEHEKVANWLKEQGMF